MLPVYLINLDRCPERLAFMAGQFEALGVPWRRLRAVDAFEREFVRPLGSEGLTDAEVACWRSHQHCWREICEQHPRGGVVIEDDVHLAQSFASVLGQLENCPADLVKLETSFRRVFLGQAMDGGESLGTRLYELQSWHGGAACYFVSAHACLQLLALPIGRWPVDVVLFEPMFQNAGLRLLTAQAVPAVAVQDQILGKLQFDSARAFQSTIAPKFKASHRGRQRSLGQVAGRIGYKVRVWFSRLIRIARGQPYERVPIGPLVKR